MKTFARLIVAGVVAGTVAGAAGSVAAGSSGKRAFYPPVPKVTKNSAIPRKDPLAARPALAPKSSPAAKSSRARSASGAAAPLLGVERPAPERRLPDTPVAASAGPTEANGTE